MKQLLFILIVSQFSFGQTLQVKKSEKTHSSTLIFSDVGTKIKGDFNGDGKTEFATAVKIKEGHGNLIEDGTSDEYEIQFSDKNVKSFKAGCCEIRLIREGDLNNDGTDEISIFQAPMNGCTYSMTTCTFQNKYRFWTKVFDTFLIPTACRNFSDKDLKKRVFKVNNAIYHFETSMSTETEKLVKRKASKK